MATNPFKAFHAFQVSDVPTPDDSLFKFEEKDPSAGMWRTIGLTCPDPIDDSMYEQDINGCRLWAVRFNERILPGKVRDEHLAKAVVKLQAMTGKVVTKQEYAQLRDQVEFDLLPKAFIRRSTVYVAFYDRDDKTFMLVFTSSAKRADDVVGLMRAIFGDDLQPWPVQAKMPVVPKLISLAVDGELYASQDGEHYIVDECGAEFYSGNAAVLKGEERKTIRIKDKALEDGDIQELLKQGYQVQEIAGTMGSGPKAEDTELEFTVNHNLAFKALNVPNVKPAVMKEDFIGFAVICIQLYKRLLHDFLSACGGLDDRPGPDEDRLGIEDNMAQIALAAKQATDYEEF